MSVVGKVSELAPGEMKAVDVEGSPVALANVEGQIYAFSDICTHVGCTMHDGTLEGTVAVCPCHGSRFDVKTGDVVRGPARTPLKSYAVSVTGDDISVG